MAQQEHAVRVTRAQLYDLVWQAPLRTLAQRFGISDVGLAKTCRRMRIPLPGRGHWAKKAAGKRVSTALSGHSAWISGDGFMAVRAA